MRYPPRIIETLAQITTPDGKCGGLVLWDNTVVEAADVFKYMRKWSRDRVRSYCQQRGWKVSLVWEMVRDRP